MLRRRKISIDIDLQAARQIYADFDKAVGLAENAHTLRPEEVSLLESSLIALDRHINKALAEAEKQDRTRRAMEAAERQYLADCKAADEE